MNRDTHPRHDSRSPAFEAWGLLHWQKLPGCPRYPLKRSRVFQISTSVFPFAQTECSWSDLVDERSTKLNTRLRTLRVFWVCCPAPWSMLSCPQILRIRPSRGNLSRLSKMVTARDWPITKPVVCSGTTIMQNWASPPRWHNAHRDWMILFYDDWIRDRILSPIGNMHMKPIQGQVIFSLIDTGFLFKLLPDSNQTTSHWHHEGCRHPVCNSDCIIGSCVSSLHLVQRDKFERFSGRPENLQAQGFEELFEVCVRPKGGLSHMARSLFLRIRIGGLSWVGLPRRKYWRVSRQILPQCRGCLQESELCRLLCIWEWRSQKM